MAKTTRLGQYLARWPCVVAVVTLREGCRLESILPTGQQQVFLQLVKKEF